MVYFGRGFYLPNNPAELLNNEWVVFSGIFLMTFAIVYLALANFFTKEKVISPLQAALGIVGKGKEAARGPLIVIAAVVSLFTAASVTRNGLFAQYLGNVVGLWVGVFVLIVLVMLLAPFYKGLKANIGKIPAIVVVIFAFWLLLKFMIPYDFFYSLPYEAQDWYNLITSIGGLVVLEIVGVVFGLIKK